MFNFIFSLIWTAFVTPIFIMCLVIPGEQRNGADMNLFLFTFFLVFELIGLYLLISGLKKIIKDKKTKKHGIQCYGIISDIRVTGASVNNMPEYKAMLHFFNPETHQVEIIEEIIGFDYDKYQVNYYILCKYFQGDINIEGRISESIVPIEIKEYLAPVQQKNNNSSTGITSNGEYVTVDGIQYKKNQ